MRTTSDKPHGPALKPGPSRQERPRSRAGRIRGLRSESGVAIVEFALVLPFLLLVLLAIIDFGRAINYWIDTTHLASEGARLAAVDRVPAGSSSLQEYIRNKADTNELRDGGSRWIESPLQVCVLPGGDAVGDSVEVKVTTTYKWFPILGIGPTTDITGSATMRREQPRQNVSETCS